MNLLNSTSNAIIDPEVTEEAWLREIFGRQPYLMPIGINKWKYMADHLSDYFKWLEKKKGINKEYAITLTTNVTDPEQWPTVEQEMVTAISKIFTQQTCPVIEAEAYLEYQTSGAPHIHGWYKCDKGHRIYQKIFKRYWPLWNENVKVGKGHQGGYHEAMKTNKYRDYQSAEGRKVYP